MPVVGLHIDVQHAGESGGEAVLERLSVAFERTGEELRDFSTHVWPKLTPVFEAEERRQFDAQGGGPRGEWAPLTDAYARRKELLYPGNPILVASGALKAALTESSSPLATRAYSGQQFEFGTSGLEYASYHQVGTERMVARPPFDFSDDFERDVTEAALEAAREAMASSGLDELVEVVP